GRAEQEGGGLEQGGAEAASINLRKNLDGTFAFLGNRLTANHRLNNYRRLYRIISSYIRLYKLIAEVSSFRNMT
ncbi:hypothetical protein, partial [Collinsella aerofaciens]|uniref:hypothetical protein n=1 Tax=Collinsella aerofaciens TaxID=74426 RepID=UPI00232B7400